MLDFNFHLFTLTYIKRQETLYFAERFLVFYFPFNLWLSLSTKAVHCAYIFSQVFLHYFFFFRYILFRSRGQPICRSIPPSLSHSAALLFQNKKAFYPIHCAVLHLFSFFNPVVLWSWWLKARFLTGSILDCRCLSALDSRAQTLEISHWCLPQWHP